MNKTRVMAKYEKEDGSQSALRAANFEQVEGGAMTVTAFGIGPKWEVRIDPAMLESFAIELISDTTYLAQIYGGGLVGYGVAALMSRWIKLPVIELSQPNAAAGHRWVQITVAGVSRRKKTRDFGLQLEQALRESGYSGLMPAELHDEDVWKVPVVPMLAGCGIALAAIFICLIIIFGVVAFTEM